MSNILFFGDLASPDNKCSLQLLESMKKHESVFINNSLIGNFEGLIADISTKTKTPVLFNHPSVLEALNFGNTKALTLANNHTLDLPESFDYTLQQLKEKEIVVCGAGYSEEEAESPAVFEMNGIKFFVFGYCWGVMVKNKKKHTGVLHVAKIREEKIVKRIEQLRSTHPDSKIIMLMHWNFDLETLPFPYYREFSKAMIDSGANAIIGSHSHCVQGAERYKSGFIGYSLGNFFMPWHTFINGKIEFPEFSRLTLALEWNPLNNDLVCHWFYYKNSDGNHLLELQSSESFDESKTLLDHTPFKGMSPDEYIKFFEKNRRKGFLVPIYKHYNNSFQNSLFDFYIKRRIHFVRFLAKNNLRGWNN